MSFVFGCRVNEAEKQQLDKQLIENGFIWNEKQPAFYIINSCAVTGKAEREVRQHIYQIRKRFPKSKIIVTGCSATLWIKNKTLLQEADHYVNNKDKNSILQLMTRGTSNQKPKQTKEEFHDKFLKSGKMMVKIQEGCNRFCSYCIVPYLRGPVKSETVSDIIKLIIQNQKLAKEVILTAINTDAFGKDTKETLIQLIESILMNTKVERVSFGSIHPWSITKEFLDWYRLNKDNPRFVHFFHIPIQSGSNTILKLMNRKYTTKELLDNLNMLHEIDPNALIATDIIVGFPGETEIEFQETYTFLKNSPITKFHVFRYSNRPGTAASQLPNEPTFQIKRERSKKLIDLSTKKSSGERIIH